MAMEATTNPAMEQQRGGDRQRGSTMNFVSWKGWLTWLISAAVLFVPMMTLSSDPKTVTMVGLEWKFKIVSSLPIKNLSVFDVNTTIGGQYIDAAVVAQTVDSLARQSLHFSSSLSEWSEAVFIPAACYVPLCGNDFENLTWVETEISTLPTFSRFEMSHAKQDPNEPNFISSEELEFPVCCALADTEPNGDNEECVVNPIESCRMQYLDTACPTLSERSDSLLELDDLSASEFLSLKQEEVPECIGDEPIMQLLFIYEEEIAPESCCLTCSCYGDPRCVSFDKESDLWILCDARAPRDSEDPNSVCEIQEEQCDEEEDHEGNSCLWISLSEEEEDEWSTIVNGSRCVPSTESGESWIVMYEFDEFEFLIRQGERGVIDKVSITLDEDIYTMSAADCYVGDFNNTWSTVIDDEEEFIVPPQGFAQIIETPAEGLVEFLWVVTDQNTLVHARIRCLTQKDSLGRSSQPRIHIDALVEPEVEIDEARGEAFGFCVSGSLDSTGTTSNTELIESGDGCQPNGALTNDEELQVARSLCGPGLLYSSLATCAVSFCEENYFPNFIDYAECVTMIGDGVEGFDFRDAFCLAMTFTEQDRTNCLALWDNLDGLSGPLIAIEIYYPSAFEPFERPSTDCAETVSELPSRLGACEPGVELQYLDDSLEWITFLGIPERFAPCSILEFNFVDHEPLFVNPIRLKQCTISSACLTANNKICESQKGFAAQFLLRPGVEPVPTLSPTESPTGVEPQETLFPSLNPTRRPTEFPTHKPTKSPSQSLVTSAPTGVSGWGSGKPTESPTHLPEPLTVAPTGFPTVIPTESPTISPTHLPTSSPTEFPTVTPTRSPSTPFPSQTPTEGPSWSPSFEPSVTPTETPTEQPTVQPTEIPTNEPTASPTDFPTLEPTVSPTAIPTESPSHLPTTSPTSFPTTVPTNIPTEVPTESPSHQPTEQPTETPTFNPTKQPTHAPSWSPSVIPTEHPTAEPTEEPTESPTVSPTNYPSVLPTEVPSETPTESPTISPAEALIPDSTPSPTPYPTEWGKGQLKSDLHDGAKVVDFQQQRMPKRQAFSQGKLDYEEAGHVLLFGMYSSEYAAEKEALASNISFILENVNEMLQRESSHVLAVECELKLLKMEVFDTEESLEEEPPTNDFDFLNLGSNWKSIAVAATAGFVALVLMTLTCVSYVKSSSSGGSIFDISYDI